MQSTKKRSYAPETMDTRLSGKCSGSKQTKKSVILNKKSVAGQRNKKRKIKGNLKFNAHSWIIFL